MKKNTEENFFEGPHATEAIFEEDVVLSNAKETQSSF
jgi:hypothetical protein